MRPRGNRTLNNVSLKWLSKFGIIGAWIRDHDWTHSPLGPIEGWPEELLSSLRICLNAQFPFVVMWGQDFLYFYNELSIPKMGSKHPLALGKPAGEIWSETWTEENPAILRRVF